MMTDVSEKPKEYRPRIIIHGGAGNISRAGLPFEAYQAYRQALLELLEHADARFSQDSHSRALDVATDIVSRLENNPLWNAGRGAVYTTSGTHELEASVMVSQGFHKRGVGVMQVRRTKNPILLAKELLVRGEEDGGGGAGSHCQITGETCERLAEQWGLEKVNPSYFWTKRRWDEHRKGLGLETSFETYEKLRRAADDGVTNLLDSGLDSHSGDPSLRSAEKYIIDETSGRASFIDNDPSWNGHEYLPQGTVGCVVLDSTGTLCVATSTGGLTNKLPGRIGDTPTIGAGFFAESWPSSRVVHQPQAPIADLAALFSDCLPGLSGYMSLQNATPRTARHIYGTRSVAVSGTGSGDSFLRLAAARTAAAMCRYGSTKSFQDAVTAVAGPNGALQQSAGDRWKRSGEGEGGMIGIEFDSFSGKGKIVADFNSCGMFRAWIDDDNKRHMMVFRDAF